MNACDEFRDWWQRRLDRETSTEACPFEEHLSACPTCRDLHRAARNLEDTIRGLAGFQAREGLVDEITSAVLADRRRLRARRWVARAAIAAAVFLAMGLGYSRWQAPEPDPASRRETKTADARPARELPRVRVSVNQQFKEAGSALASLVGRTAGEAAEDSRVLLPAIVPAPTLGEVQGWSEPLDQRARELRQTGQGVSESLEPVAASARRAVVLLFSGTRPDRVR